MGAKIRLSIIISLLILSFTFQVPFCYANEPSSWAKSDVDEIISMSLMPEILSDKPYADPITRAEFCHLICNMYKKVMGVDIPMGLDGFADTFDVTICGAAELGIINGYEDGYFYPDNPINRQELATIICRTLKLCGENTDSLPDTALARMSEFSDAESISEWAHASMAYCISNSLIQGTSPALLNPLGYTSREQAIVIVNRCIKNLSSRNPYDLLKCDVSGDVELVSYENRALTLKWPEVTNATSYTVGLYLSQDNFWYSTEDTFVKLYSSQSPTITLKNMRAGKKYNIVIDALDADGNVLTCLYGKAYPNELYALSEKEALIFGDGQITTKEEADAQMQTITVKAWALDKSGNKYPSTLTMTVHKKIAYIVELAFDEIYNGEEKFPFKDAGAYAWRDTMSNGTFSHHNYGTAIDLNYNENYCLYKNGSFVGLYWKPYEDAYSFPPDGEVISIFAKYGFAWGGDEWSNPKDYMHFSFLEL